MKRTHKLINKINVIKGVFLLMCITIIAANLNISQAVKAVETTQDNKIKSGEVENQKYTGTCRDNQGWIENPEDNDIYSVAYFVKNDNRRFETIDNPITAPNKYYKISCSSISRVHYKDTNGNLLKINNQFVTSVISRDIDEVTETVVNGKLETTRTNKKITDTYYINTGNDYVAKFPTNPNQGFYFKTNKLYDGAVFEVIKVSIGGKSLKANIPIVNRNILTYPEVLPGVDLIYSLNTNGISKYFEIKNADAVKNNDLTSYSFDLADNTKIEKKDEKKDKLQSILENKGVTSLSTPTLTNAKEGVELVKETKEVLETKTTVTPTIITPSSSTPITSASSNSAIPITTSPLSSSSSSASSQSSASAIPAILPPKPEVKTETITSTQNKTETEIQAVKETVKSEIVKELDTKIVKLEEIKKEEEAKGDKKDVQLLELTQNTINSTKSLTAEVKTNTINVSDEGEISNSIKVTENVSSGTEVLSMPNNEDKIQIGLPIIFDQEINKTKTIASSISQAKDKITIGVDKDYLQSTDRKFPIYIDPDFQGNTWLDGSKNTFVNITNSYSPNGTNHRTEIGLGRKTSDNTNNAIYGESIALLGFKVGASENASRSIVSGKLITHMYQTTPGYLQVSQSTSFDERTVTFSNRPSIIRNVDYANGPSRFENYQVNGTNMPQQVISYLDLKNVDRNQIIDNTLHLALQSDGYAWICAKDFKPGFPCSNPNVSPYLEVTYTKNPTSPTPTNFVNSDSAGQCNKSKPEGQNGNCNVVESKKLEFSGVNSGDGNSEYSKTKIISSNKLGMSLSNEDGNIQSQNYETSFSNNDNRTDSALANIGSGVFKNTFWNEDNFGKISPFKTEYYQHDNGSPVAYSGIKTEGAKASDGSYLIGRSDPNNTQPQVKFTVPDYLDATYNKFSVIPSWDKSKILDIAGGFNPVIDNQAHGRHINLNSDKKYNLDAQVFSQDGAVIRANNSSYCWDQDRGSNGRLVIARCTGAENQKFSYDPSSNQFKLLDQAFQYGDISILSIPDRTMNTWGGSNDNQTVLKIGEKSSSINTQYRYNTLTRQITNAYGKCLDTGQDKVDQDLRIHDCNGGGNQKFYYDAKSRLIGYTSGLCIDSAAGGQVGSRLYMFYCHEGGNQKFKIQYASDQQSTEITVKNAKNCVEGSQLSSELYIRPCSNNQYQKFEYSTESVIRITAPGGKNDKGASFNSAQLKGLGRYSGIKSISTSMVYQYMRYLNNTKQIRSNENVCLALNESNLNDVLFENCDTRNNFQWIEEINNGKKNIVNLHQPGGNKLCLTSNTTNDDNVNIFASTCNGGANQEFGFENYQKYLFPNNEMKYQARISESIDGKTGTSIVIPWQSSPEFQFNSDQNLSEAFKAINENKYTLKLEDGKSYFVSMQAKDRSSDVANISAWSEPSRIVIDTTLPAITNFKTIIKGNDKKISFDVNEKNFDSAFINVFDINNKLVKTITNCNGTNCKDIDTSITKNLLFDFDGKSDNGIELSDGNYRIEPFVKDKSGNLSADSKAVGGANIMDTDINGVIGKSPNIILFSNSASIYVVSPSNNSWVNKDIIKIEGSSGRVNSIDTNGVSITKAIKQLDFSKFDLDGPGNNSTGTASEKLPFNLFNNFTKEVKLDFGKNEFKIVTTDADDAQNSKIGDTSTARVDSWVINREDIAPIISDVKFDGKTSVQYNYPTINDSKATIEFTVEDTSPNQLYTSGLNIGDNPKGYDLSLLRSVDDLKSFREIPLFRDGVNISDPNPNPRLVGNLNCAAIDNAAIVKTKTRCKMQVDNLKLDAFYKLHIKARDIAGNESCARHYEYIEKALNNETKCNAIKPSLTTITGYKSSPTTEYYGYDIFRVKTFTYLNADNTTDYEVLPNDVSNINTTTATQSFSGLKTGSYTYDVEENAYLNFKYVSTNRSIIIDPKVPIAPFETDMTDTIPNFAKAYNYYKTPTATLASVTSVCGSSVDHDLIIETPVIKTCKVTINLIFDMSLERKKFNWENRITVFAINGVMSNIYKTNTIVDFTKYNLGTSASSLTLSPDGDGKFDTINFNHTLDYKGRDLTKTLSTPDNIKYSIKNSSDKVVFEPDMKKVVSGKSYTFDGKVLNKVLPDGQYKFYVTMDSRARDGTRITSNILTFNLVSNITAAMAPVIITPAPDFTTTRGVITLQGNGVKSDLKNISNSWSVDVCARLSNKSLVNTTIQALIPANGCVYQSSVKTSNKGFYTLLVTLPYANQSYDIEVKSTNPNGNQSSPTVTTKVNYNTPDSIADFAVTSSIDGLNTADQMKCAFGNATTVTGTIKCDTVNVNNLKTLKISTTVLKGVEGVELDFNDLTNLNALPANDKNDYNNQYTINNGKRIAIINDLTEVKPKFNPGSDSRVKTNQAGALIVGSSPIAGVATGKDLSYASMRKPCLEETCTWIYYYILPYQMAGGKYEVRARTYKGESVQQATASFEVNGIVRLAPKIIRAQKDILSSKCQYVTAFEPTGVDAKNCGGITGVGGIGGSIESVTLKSINNEAGSVATGIANASAITNQTKIQTFYTNKDKVRLFVGGDIKSSFNYKLTNGPVTLVDQTGVTSDKGLAELNLTLNGGSFGNNVLVITPINNSTKVLNPAEATVYSIIYDNTAPLVDNVITFDKSSGGSGVTQSINPWIRNGDQVNFDIKTVGNETVDYGYVISESGYREPLKLVNTNGIISYQADLTIQREKLEGVYYPTIYLQDLAGNSSIVNNDPSKVLLGNIINDVKPNLKRNINGVVTYDFDQLAYTDIKGPNSTYQSLPVNNSINIGDGRKASKDFTLYLDNTRPLRGDFNMLGVGDTLIEYDASTGKPKLNSTLQSPNSTRLGAIRTDGILASNVGIGGEANKVGTGSNIPVGVNGNGMLEIDRMVGQKTDNPNNSSVTKDNTNQGYSLVTRNNLVELRISAERNTRLVLQLKEGKDSAGGGIGGTNNQYSQEQIISPSSSTIDNQSCTTNPTSISRLGVNKSNQTSLVRLAGSKNGLYKPELQSLPLSPTLTEAVKKQNVINAYDNNLISMASNDPRANSDKLGYSASGSVNDRVVTQSATYCDIIFTYDFKNRTDSNGKKISEGGTAGVTNTNGVNGAKQVGIGESPNGNALEYFNISFYSVDLAGNANVSDEEYSKLLNRNDLKVFNSVTGKNNTIVDLYSDLQNGTSNVSSLGGGRGNSSNIGGTNGGNGNSNPSGTAANGNCAYNPTTGQLDPNLFSLQEALKTSDIVFPKSSNTVFSCIVNVRYDAEAAINQSTVPVTAGGVVVPSSGLGVKTSVTNITSTSYRGGGSNGSGGSNGNGSGSNGSGGNVAGGDILPIPDLANTEFNQQSSNGKNVAITRDTSINVTTTGEARADMVYSVNSGYADSSNVLIQYPTWNPLTLPNVNVQGSGYKEYGTTVDIKSSRNQQSKQITVKQDSSKALLDKLAPYELYYPSLALSQGSNLAGGNLLGGGLGVGTVVDTSTSKLEPNRFTNYYRVLQNGELDNPTRTTSFDLGRNSTVKTPSIGSVVAVDNKGKRDEDSSKKSQVATNFTALGGNSSLGTINAGAECTKVTNDAITTSGLGTIPATVNRRVGVCDDGLYKINTFAVDSAGNVSLGVDGKPVVASKIVERDTVSPNEPVVNNTITGDILGQILSLSVNGEANTIVKIVVATQTAKTNVDQVYGYRLDSSGNFSSSNLLGQLSCETNYSIDITLTDRAGNVSKVKNVNFRTQACPICPTYRVIDKTNEAINVGATSGKYTIPIRGVPAPSPEQSYGATRTFNGRTWGHEGIDFNGAGNPPVYSIGSGVVTQSEYTVYGNTIRVDHQNGTVSMYGHLDKMLVKKGDSVTSDTKIGIAGNTGPYSVGAHLHLNIYVGGKQVNPSTILDTNYSYTPIVAESNSRYAVLQTSPGTLTIDEARRFGCDVPALPADPAYVFGGDGFDSTSDDDDLIELASVDSDQINVTAIIDKIAGDLRDDFNYYFKLTTNCDWYNVDCHKANAVNLIDKVKRFLELLINGMIKGLQKAGSNLIQEFQNIFNTLKDLINDPVKTITEVVKEVQKMFENVLSMISKAGDFLKIIVNNIKDFITGDRESRITSLGSAFGLFIGEKIADAVKGVLSGGPIAAIANVIKGIIDKLKDIAKVVIKTIQLVGEKIAFGVNGVVLTIKKSVSNRVGILVSEVRKFSLEAIESLPLSPAHKSSLRDLRKFNDIYATLKTPDWMSRDRVQHVLMGHDGGGAHSLKSIGGGQSQFNGIKGVKNPNGTYKAEVSVFRAKTGKFEPKKTHTMFPDEWDQQTIIDSIVAAKEKADPSKWIKGGKNTSQDILHNNVTIKIVLYPDGTLCTAYPI